MTDRVYSIPEIKAIATPIAKRHGIAALYLFGSYARGEATPESDLDFRIDKGQIRTLLQLAHLQIDLEQTFQKDMDVLTTPMLSQDFLDTIKDEEVLLYAQG